MNRIKLVLVIAVFMLVGRASAEPIVNSIEGVSGTDTVDRTAKQFVYQYTPEVKLVLLADKCDREDLGDGWIAYAEKDTGDRAYGCWRHYNDGQTVIMVLDAGERRYLDYRIYNKKFKAEY